MATVSGHSFNIEPMGKMFKFFSSGTSKPIRSYAKTMSAEGGHLGWRSGSPDTILKVDHLRTIHAMFALNSDIVLT
jgi:hypothetical protein